MASALLSALYSEAIKKPMVAVIENHIACLNEEPSCNRGGSRGGEGTQVSEASGSGGPSDSPEQEPPDEDKGGWSGLLQKGKEFASDAWDGVTEPIADAWNGLQEYASDSIDNAKDRYQYWLDHEGGREKILAADEFLSQSAVYREFRGDIIEGNWLRYSIRMLNYMSGAGITTALISELTGFDLIKWGVDNPGATLTMAAGVGMLFFPPTTLLGIGVLSGGGISGAITAFSGGSADEVADAMFIGGLTGLIGGGVAGGVARAGLRYIGQRAAQWVGASIGSSSESLADNFLRGEKLNWKNAAAAGLFAFGSVVGLNAAKNSIPTFGITPKSNQVANQASKNADPNVVAGVKKPPVTPSQFDNVRKDMGLPARIGDDDPYTTSVLRIDGHEYWGKNGKWVTKGKTSNYTDKAHYDKVRKELGTSAEVPGHAEGVAFNKAYQVRKNTGTKGGNAVLYVDKIPCVMCKPGIATLMRSAKVDHLDLHYLQDGKMHHVQYVRNPDTDAVYNPFSGKWTKPSKKK